MKLVNITHVKPNMILARALMDATGKVSLPEETVLARAHIDALGKQGYDRIYIKDTECPVDVEMEEDVSPAVRSLALGALHRAFAAIKSEVGRCCAESKASIDDVLGSESIGALMSNKGALANIPDVAAKIVQDVLTRRALAGLTSVRSADSTILDHSIDVCAVSIMIGRAVGLDAPHLRQLAAGALLHDVGAALVEPDAVGRARIIQHTQRGYELLRRCENKNALTPHAAHEHHEHQDGSGLPRGLHGSNTIERDRMMPPPVPTLVGEIATVANIYDSLLSGSDKRAGRPTDEVLAAIRHAAGTILNRSVVMALLKLVPPYPKGAEVVVLSGDYRGFAGIVTKVHPKAFDKPTVLILRDDKSTPIVPEELDLSKADGVALRCQRVSDAPPAARTTRASTAGAPHR